MRFKSWIYVVLNGVFFPQSKGNLRGQEPVWFCSQRIFLLLLRRLTDFLTPTFSTLWSGFVLLCSPFSSRVPLYWDVRIDSCFLGWPRSAYLLHMSHNMLSIPCWALNRGIKWISCAPRFASVWRFAQVEPGTSCQRTEPINCQSKYSRFFRQIDPLLIAEPFPTCPGASPHW